MNAGRRLVLKRESLTEITTDDLRTVGGAAAATLAAVCGTGITVFVHGCASDPRYCYYVTDFC